MRWIIRIAGGIFLGSLSTLYVVEEVRYRQALTETRAILEAWGKTNDWMKTL